MFMKNSLVIFILGGIFLLVAIVIGYIYIPHLDQVNGTQTISDLSLDLPVKRIDLRYIDGGIIPFCNDNETTGITFEVKPNAEVYSSTEGAIVKVEDNRVTVNPKHGVDIEYSNLKDISVSTGDFVTVGSLLGHTVDNSVLLSVININDDIYECPYIYFTDDVKLIVDDIYNYSDYSNINICNCNILKFK